MIEQHSIHHTEHHKQPLVSICIPTYNGARYLKETLDSCLSQTYKNVDILISDDGSTDETFSLVQSYMSTYPQIRLHRNSSNLGLVGNWKKCIELAKGDWIKFIFQDDVMKEDCVARMMEACIDNDTLMCICSRTFLFEPDSDEKIKLYYSHELSRGERLFRHNSCVQPEESKLLVSPFVIENVLGEPICTLFHRTLYRAVGGYQEELKQVVDYEFGLKAILSFPFTFIPEPLVVFRVHGSSTTGTTHAGSAAKSAVTEKMIQSTVGDFIRLIGMYKSDARFSCFLEYWGIQRLNLLERYLYLRACKYYSKFKVKNALAKEINNNINLKKCPYSLFRYKWAKYQYKKQIKPWMNQYGNSIVKLPD